MSLLTDIAAAIKGKLDAIGTLADFTSGFGTTNVGGTGGTGSTVTQAALDLKLDITTYNTDSGNIAAALTSILGA